MGKYKNKGVLGLGGEEEAGARPVDRQSNRQDREGGAGREDSGCNADPSGAAVENYHLAYMDLMRHAVSAPTVSVMLNLRLIHLSHWDREFSSYFVCCSLIFSVHQM